ncbi:hypothetical protein NXF25_010277 [Crotalus adamanteus]|uniref:Gypsy retrotransposon integrase-like protein 1 n=1 Tax=Crotalus adamanteus TaxID=8729 RepID=A0AAW1BJE8_CROAD
MPYPDGPNTKPIEEIVNSVIMQSEVSQVKTGGPSHTKSTEPDNQITKRLKEELKTDPWFLANKTILTYQDRLAWKGSKLYLPETLRIEALQRSHDSKQAGHFGYLKTLHLIQWQFWWQGLKKDVENYVKSCPIYATMKKCPGNPPGLLQQAVDPTQPWEEIAMDFIVELPESRGNTVIWTVIDLFSKQAHFIACTSLPSAKKLARMFLKHIYQLHGAPKRIISDRGVQFTAKFWRDFLKLIGSTQGLLLAFHPSTNGAAEKANLMTEQYIRCYLDYQQTIWADLLPFAEMAYNNTVHSNTGLTPFKIATGREFIPMPELPQNLLFLKL